MRVWRQFLSVLRAIVSCGVIGCALYVDGGEGGSITEV